MELEKRVPTLKRAQSASYTTASLTGLSVCESISRKPPIWSLAIKKAWRLRELTWSIVTVTLTPALITYAKYDSCP